MSAGLEPSVVTASQSPVETRKVELWMGVLTYGVYRWMVYDFDRPRTFWFDDETEARTFLAELQAGSPTPEAIDPT